MTTSFSSPWNESTVTTLTYWPWSYVVDRDAVEYKVNKESHDHFRLHHVVFGRQAVTAFWPAVREEERSEVAHTRDFWTPEDTPMILQFSVDRLQQAANFRHHTPLEA